MEEMILNILGDLLYGAVLFVLGRRRSLSGANGETGGLSKMVCARCFGTTSS